LNLPLKQKLIRSGGSEQSRAGLKRLTCLLMAAGSGFKPSGDTSGFPLPVQGLRAGKGKERAG